MEKYEKMNISDVKQYTTLELIEDAQNSVLNSTTCNHQTYDYNLRPSD